MYWDCDRLANSIIGAIGDLGHRAGASVKTSAKRDHAGPFVTFLANHLERILIRIGARQRKPATLHSAWRIREQRLHQRMILTIENQVSLHHEICGRRANRRFDQIVIPMSKKMDTYT